MMTRLIVPVLIIQLIFGPFLPLVVEAATTIEALSCNYMPGVNTDVGDAVSAASDGDTVLIPAGTCTWTAELFINKMITFAGFARVPRVTTLAEAQAIETVCNTLPNTTYTCIKRSGDIVTNTLTATGTFEWRNMAVLTTGGSCVGTNAPSNIINGNSDNFILTGTLFAHSSGCGSLGIFQNVNGVVYDNTFFAHNGSTHAITTEHGNWLNTGTYGDFSWASPLTLGSASVVGTTTKALYIEENTFVTDIGTTVTYTDHERGCRVVERFNRILGGGSLQTHGTETGGRIIRGCVQRETYRNLIVWDKAANSIIANRGVGVGLMFDNKQTGTVQGAVAMVNMNQYRSRGGQPVISMSVWGFCGKLAVNLVRSGSTATATTTGASGLSAWHGVHTSGSYVEITGAGAPFDGVFFASGAIISNSTGTNSGFSVSGNTVTTVNPHGWATGNIVSFSQSFAGESPDISNTSGTTPNYVITVTGANTFTIPTTTSAGGTGGSVSNLSVFTFTVDPSGATSATGTMQSPFDGNQDNFGYPCLDQPGRGPGQRIAGDQPNVTVNGVTPVDWPNQEQHPFYCWHNTSNGVLNPCAPQHPNIIQNLRDYYNENPSYNGTTQRGIGRGPRDTRPQACTAGDRWWATDDEIDWNTSLTDVYSDTPGEDGAMDECIVTGNPTGVWAERVYVPAPMPHPARGLAVAAANKHRHSGVMRSLGNVRFE